MKRMREVREEIWSRQGEVGLVQNEFRYELLEKKSLMIENKSQFLKEKWETNKSQYNFCFGEIRS